MINYVNESTSLQKKNKAKTADLPLLIRLIPLISMTMILSMSVLNDWIAFVLLLLFSFIIAFSSFYAFIVFYVSLIPAQFLLILSGFTLMIPLGLILVIFFIRDLAKGRMNLIFNREVLFYLAILFMIIVSSLFASLFTQGDWLTFRSNVLVITSALLIYLKVRTVDISNLKTMMKSVFLSSFMLSFVCLYIVGIRVIHFGLPRLIVQNENSSWLASMIAIYTFFGMPAFLKGSRTAILAVPVTIFFNMQFILSTQSRTSWLVLLTMAMAFLVYSRYSLKKSVYFFVLFLVIVSFFAFVILGWTVIYNRIFRSYERFGVTGLLSGRDYLTKAGLEVFKQFPILGIGNSSLLERQYVGDITGSYNIAHNGYVMILLRFGIIGFVVFISFCVNSVRTILHAEKYRTIFLGAMVGYLIATFSSSPFFNDFYMSIIAVILGFSSRKTGASEVQHADYGGSTNCQEGSQ